MSAPISQGRGSPMQDEFKITSLIAPLLAVILGTFMVILDSTVVNVAIPTLVEYFDTNLHTLQWSITGYTLALSAVIPLAGWMTDKFGSKRIFLITIALFTIGSVLCAMAQTPEQLILFRILQGLGGGMVSPIGMAMIFKLSPPDKRGAVMGMLGIPMLLAPASGPVLSGWLVEYVTWHWIFLINLPIGIAAVIAGIKFLPQFEGKGAAPSLDIIGMILAPIAFAMLAFGVSEGGVEWTSPRTLTGLIVGGVALILFILNSLRVQQPLLELRVFKSSDFTRGVLLSWIMQVALFGSILLFPLLLQQIKGYSPLETGLILLPQAIGSMIFIPISGKLFDKIGARPLVLIGLTLISTSLFMISRVTLDTGLPLIMTLLFLIGSGMGLSMMTLNTHVLNAAPRHLVSRVTPLTTAAQQVVTSFAIAGLTGYLTSQINKNLAEATATGGNPLEGSMTAFGSTFQISAWIAAVGVVFALVLRKPKPQPNPPQADSETDPSSSAAMMMGH